MSDITEHTLVLLYKKLNHASLAYII